MFDWCRESAWDLWGAAAVIAGLCGIEIFEVADAPGQGPNGNVAVQEGNYRTATLCWLLYRLKYVKKVKSFANFDT